MGQLRNLQEELKRILFFGREASGSPLWKEGLPERLEVYRNNVRLNWIETLETNFPFTKKQFSVEEWNHLARAFFAKHPPKHWELNTAIVPFGKFLGSEDVKPFIKELADYELTDLQTFIHPARPRLGMGVTNPTVSVRVYQHQIFYWVQAKAPSAQPPHQKPEVLIFYRDVKNTRHIEEADPLMLLLVEHFRSPRARLENLEPVRQRLLPTNHVPLERVLDTLKESQIILQ